MATRTDGQRAARIGTGRAALLAGSLLAAAGCMTTRATAGTAYTFTIQFEKGCPVSPMPGKLNCPDAAKDCLAVSAAHMDTVTFRASDDSSFDLVFDPFRRVRASGQTFAVAADTPPGTYHFFVTAKGCTPLDPRIIVQ
jgi:hypothetical protein